MRSPDSGNRRIKFGQNCFANKMFWSGMDIFKNSVLAIAIAKLTYNSFSFHQFTKDKN